MWKGSIALAVSLLCAARPLAARQDYLSCGTHGQKAVEQLDFHRRASLQRQAAGRRAPLVATTHNSRDMGDIAVLEDTGDIVALPVAFNLELRTVSFIPLSAGAGRYRFETGVASYDQDLASRGTALSGLADDDAREVSLPFAFPFYGGSHTRLFINSDGNLTFGAPDTATSERSLGRLAAGPPRIAPFFRDLDPSRSPAGVRVLAEPGRLVVSWVNVPEYSSSGTGPLQSFQVRLFPSGRIELAFSTVRSAEAVVGISPGGGVGVVSIVAFRDGSSGEYSGAVAERFASRSEVDIYTAALRFYEAHEDAYDYLVFFNNMGVGAAPGALAYEVTARNLHRAGFGDPPIDIGGEFNSPRRLQAVLNMGPLSQYPADPDSRIGLRGFATGDTGLTIIGHEAGHLFLAFASVRDPLDYERKSMLKADGGHWSFNFNSEASLLEGNRLRDNGDGTFTTTGTVEGFSALDQYLMGLRPAGEVPPTFLVDGSSISDDALPSARTVTFQGRRRDVRVEDLVRTEGRRTPDPTVAQRHFRFAFILIIKAGTFPDEAELEKLQNYRARLEDVFSQWTGGRAAADTSLRRALQVSVSPAAGVLAGRSIAASVSIQQPAASTLTVTLERAGASASAPGSVTIPAGAVSATFDILGLVPGVEEFVARPSDPAYETAHARVQVLGEPSGLRLALASDGDPALLRVEDANSLPYAGIRVAASSPQGGAVSDTNGMLSLSWSGVPQLIAYAEGATPFVFDGVVNAASYSPGLAPGGFAAIFGHGLAGGAASGLPPYPADLAGVQVTVDGQPAGLHYADDRQVNLVVPGKVRTGPRSFFISAPSGSAMLARLPVLDASPGIFVYAGTNDGAILRNQNFLEIYCTGLGDGRPVTVYLGGRQLTPSWSGPHPAYPGLYQVNVEIPSGLTGDQPVSLEVAGRRGNEVRVHL